MMKQLSVVGILAIASSSACWGTESSTPVNSGRDLTVHEAGELASLAETHQIASLKRKGPFSLDKTINEPDTNFYSFDVLGLWSREQNSVELGMFSVNRRTAEVWSMLTCETVSFGKLHDAQRKILKAAGRIQDFGTRGIRPSLC